MFRTLFSCRGGPAGGDEAAARAEEDRAEFFFGVLVPEGSPVVGRSIEDAGARACWRLLLPAASWRLPVPLLSLPPPTLHRRPPSHDNPRAGLRSLSGQYVTSVRRGGSLIHAVGSEFVLAAGDVLYLSGATVMPLV